MAKSVKRVVVHPKLYMAVDGKLQRIPPGTEITITKEQCERFGDKVADPSGRKKLKDGKVSSGGDSGEVAQLTADLNAAKAETKKAQDALVKTATDLDAAKKKVKALEAAAKA